MNFNEISNCKVDPEHKLSPEHGMGHPFPGEKPPEHPNSEHPNKPTKPPERNITVIVNGINKKLPSGTKKLSYEDVVKLAYGSYDDATRIIYTVSYSNGPKENPKGTLVKGKNVKVREGMIFNVSRSDKS